MFDCPHRGLIIHSYDFKWKTLFTLVSCLEGLNKEIPLGFSSNGPKDNKVNTVYTIGTHCSILTAQTIYEYLKLNEQFENKRLAKEIVPCRNSTGHRG